MRFLFPTGKISLFVPPQVPGSSREEKLLPRPDDGNLIVSIAVSDQELLDGIRDQIGQRFSTGIKITQAGFPRGLEHTPEKGQYSACALLKYLESFRIDGNRVLGIIDVDLSYPGLNHVFGLSDPSSKVSILSIARFKGKRGDASSKRILDRAVKTAIHELGHSYGLLHCMRHRCVMFYSFNLLDTDYKGRDFCPDCEEELKRRFHANRDGKNGRLKCLTE